MPADMDNRLARDDLLVRHNHTLHGLEVLVAALAVLVPMCTFPIGNGMNKCHPMTSGHGISALRETSRQAMSSRSSLYPVAPVERSTNELHAIITGL
jgi:hypothetical protein